MSERFEFSDLREIFAKANVEKSGDQLAGVAARSERDDDRTLPSIRAALPIVWTHLGLGEKNMGFDWLEIALAEREPFLGSLMVFPAYEAIHDQPKFKQLAQQLNFPA